MPRRAGAIRISEAALRQALKIPDDVMIRGIVEDVVRNVWTLYLEGGSLPEIPEATEPPFLDFSTFDPPSRPQTPIEPPRSEPVRKGG